MKNKNTKQTKHSHPGRPKYTPVYPRTKEWTFTDWMEANGININPDSKDFGKGPNCTMLTLRKAMERDMFYHKKGKRLVAANRTYANPRSVMILVRGVTAEPNSESGLGRRATLYALRAKGASVKHATVAPVATAKPARKASTKPASTKSQTPTADALDKIHAVLAAPEPAPAAVTIPAVTIAPEATPAPVTPVAPAPVAETPAPAPEAAPAPVATESANAETATPVAQPVAS